MRKVLLTGATGFIGHHCIPLLLSRGYEVVAVSTHNDLTIDHPRLYWYKVNLLEPDQVTELLAGVHCSDLLHLAWYVAPGKCYMSSENVKWVQASLHLLQTFATHGGNRVVMAGTCAEYDWDYGYCTETLTPINPSSLYGTCKAALGSIFTDSVSSLGLSGSWGRVFFLYGPHEHPARLVSSVVLSLLRGENALCSHGNQIRDYLYVQDVADALVTLLDSEIQGPVNIASGEPVTLKSLVGKVASVLGAESLLKMGALPAAADEPGLVVGNVERLCRELDWQPSFDVDLGIDATVEWWRSVQS